MAPTTALHRGVRASLWLVIVACILCFTIITFMRPTDWYATNQEFVYIRGNMTLKFPGDVPVLTGTVVGKDGKAKVQNIGRDAPLWAGNSAFPVTLQVGPVMLAALAVAGLHLVAKAAASSRTSATAASSSPVSRGWAAFAFQARRIASYQLPPHKLWAHLCGGMSVLDAFLVATWCALAVVYLYFNINRKFVRTAAIYAPPSPAPAAPAGLNATATALNVTAPPTALPPPPADMVAAMNATNATATAAKPAGAAAAKAVDLSWEFAVRRLEGVGKSFGELLRGIMVVMFLPISRSSFLQAIFGSDFSTLIKYHRWMSWGTIWMATAHGVVYMIYWGSLATFEEELSWKDTHSKRNIMGLIAGIAGLVIAFTSTTWFRANYYKIFYRTHIIGFLVFITFAFMHYSSLVNWILPGLILYGLDRAFRYWQLVSNWTTISGTDMCLDGGILTLNLTWAKGASDIHSGQHMYLRVPAISFIESHPFSVADVAEEGDVTRVTLHMRVGGAWTHQLRQHLLQGTPLRVQVQGPYDSKLINDRQDAPVLVVIAGGIGVTPVLALLRRYARLVLSGAPVPQVHFVWASRNLCELRLMGQDLLAAAVKTLPGMGSTLSKAPSGSGSDSPTSMDSTSGWLHTALHYTGMELELEQHQQAIDLGVATKAGSLPSPGALTKMPSIPTSSPASSPTKPLHLHPSSNPFTYAISVLLTFFGAWAGMLAGFYYDGYYARTTVEGANYLAVGVLYVVLISCGAIIPTVTFLAIMHFLVNRKSSSFVQGSAHSSNTLTVLPGYVLAPGAAGGDAASLQLARGRPQMRSMLQRVREQYPHLQQVEVLVAGPDSMYHAVMKAVASLQQGCEECCQQQGPVLMVTRVAHHH